MEWLESETERKRPKGREGRGRVRGCLWLRSAEEAEKTPGWRRNESNEVKNKRNTRARKTAPSTLCMQHRRNISTTQHKGTVCVKAQKWFWANKRKMFLHFLPFFLCFLVVCVCVCVCACVLFSLVRAQELCGKYDVWKWNCQSRQTILSGYPLQSFTLFCFVLVVLANEKCVRVSVLSHFLFLRPDSFLLLLMLLLLFLAGMTFTHNINSKTKSQRCEAKHNDLARTCRWERKRFTATDCPWN